MKERIETIIDRLLEYVNLNGKVSLPKAAAALGLDVAQTERLASVLEAHGLIEIHYGLLGAMLYEKELREPKKTHAKKDEVLEEAKELEKEVLEAENLMAFFEKDLERRIVQADTLLTDLEKKEFTKKELDTIRKEVDMALGQLAAFSDLVRELNEKEQEFYQKLMAFRQKINRLEAKKEVTEPTSWWERFAIWWKRLFAKAPHEPPQNTLRSPAVTFEKFRVLRRRKDHVREHYWVRRKKT